MCGGGVLGDITKGIGDVVSAPGKWAGDVMEWTGERTGIKPLNNAGEWLTDPNNRWAQTLTGGAMLGGLGYYASPYMSTWMQTGAFPGTEEFGILHDFIGQEEAMKAAAASGAGGAGGAATNLVSPGATATTGESGFAAPNPTLANTMGGQPLYGSAMGPEAAPAVAGYTETAPAAAKAPWYSWDNMKVPATLMGVNALSQGLGAYGQQQSQQNAIDSWRENAFPNSAAVGAQTNMMYSQLAEAEALARKKYAQDAARRGLGSRSGLVSQNATDVSKAGMQAKAKALQDIIKWQNTPYSAPPIKATEGWGERMADFVGDTSSLYGSMYLMDWLKNNRR